MSREGYFKVMVVLQTQADPRILTIMEEEEDEEEVEKRSVETICLLVIQITNCVKNISM